MGPSVTLIWRKKDGECKWSRQKFRFPSFDSKSSVNPSLVVLGQRVSWDRALREALLISFRMGGKIATEDSGMHSPV